MRLCTKHAGDAKGRIANWLKLAGSWTFDNADCLDVSRI
jgi:hypothetical protein